RGHLPAPPPPEGGGLDDRRPVGRRVPDRQLRVRRCQHQPAERRRRQRHQGLPELGDHHRKPRLVSEHSRFPAALGHSGAARPGPDRGDRLVTVTLERPPTRRRHTPATLLARLIALVLLSLAWGGGAGWVADEHASAASAMATVDEPLSLDAQQLYQAVADADVTATTMFLASSQPPVASTQRYL